MKICSLCKTEKPYSDFNKNRSRVDGYRYECKACQTDSRDKTKARDATLMWTWGITREQFNTLLESQGGVCAICQRLSEEWHIDHDHACCNTKRKCGKCIRGILCRSCNLGLGHIEKMGEQNTANYLTRGYVSP